MTTAHAPITIPDDIRTALDKSGSVGMPLIISYTDPESGDSKISYRGSTHIHDDGRLALWVRKPSGSLPSHVAAAGTEGAAVDVLFRDPVSDTYLRLSGRAELSDDPAVKDKVYTDSPPHEQASDPQRKGTAMTITVTRLVGNGPDGPIRIEN